MAREGRQFHLMHSKNYLHDYVRFYYIHKDYTDYYITAIAEIQLYMYHLVAESS